MDSHWFLRLSVIELVGAHPVGRRAVRLGVVRSGWAEFASAGSWNTTTPREEENVAGRSGGWGGLFGQCWRKSGGGHDMLHLISFGSLKTGWVSSEVENGHRTDSRKQWAKDAHTNA